MLAAIADQSIHRGGLGLTGGIADVGSLSDCLLGLYAGKADMNILDKYDEVRRGIYRDIIDPLSRTNMNRMSQDAETVLENDPFLQFARAASGDPRLVAKMLEVRSVCLHAVLKANLDPSKRDLTLGCDMTQFYKTDENRAGSGRPLEHL